MNLQEATQEISGYVGSKYGRRIIRTRTYLVLRFYRFTRQGWLLAKRDAYPILQKYSYWNIRSLSSVVYRSITYIDLVSDDHMLGLGLEMCLPRTKHISDIKQLVSLNRTILT